MSNSEVLGYFAGILGSSEPALRLLISLLLGTSAVIIGFVIQENFFGVKRKLHKVGRGLAQVTITPLCQISLR